MHYFNKERCKENASTSCFIQFRITTSSFSEIKGKREALWPGDLFHSAFFFSSLFELNGRPPETGLSLNIYHLDKDGEEVLAMAALPFVAWRTSQLPCSWHSLRAARHRPIVSGSDWTTLDSLRMHVLWRWVKLINWDFVASKLNYSERLGSNRP